MATSPAVIAAIRYGGGLSAGRLDRWQVRCAQVPGRVASPSFMRRARALGLDVHVWTINDRAEMVRLLDLGVDGIMTDDISALREVLIERGQWHPRGP
jgi:glycerophosphoryl diester phosphodiesterase